MQGFSNCLGLFQVIMANPETGISSFLSFEPFAKKYPHLRASTKSGRPWLLSTNVFWQKSWLHCWQMLGEGETINITTKQNDEGYGVTMKTMKYTFEWCNLEEIPRGCESYSTASSRIEQMRSPKCSTQNSGAKTGGIPTYQPCKKGESSALGNKYIPFLKLT